MLFVAIAAAFGLVVGSFLNVCIARLPAGESIVSPRSRCPRCGAPIAWYDNVPVVSYAVLGGACRACRARISPRYVVVELITAVVFAIEAWTIGPEPLLAVRLAFAALLIALFFTDLETQRLPNALTFTGIAAGLAASVALPPGIVSSVIGAALGAGVLLGIRWLWLRFRHVDAMGLGDVKMLAMIGAFLGWPAVIVVLLLATVSGALVGVGLAVAGRGSMSSRLPFGTFLALGALAASFWGAAIVSWYVGLYLR